MQAFAQLIQAIWEPIWSLLSQVVEKFGTKFAIALCSIGGLLYLALQPSTAPPPFNYILPIVCSVGIVGIAVAYFIFRNKQETVQAEIDKSTVVTIKEDK